MPILSDAWAGLDEFFTLGAEILVADTTAEALDALRLPPGDLAAIARRARERTLDEHSAARRAAQMVQAFEDASTPVSA